MGGFADRISGGQSCFSPGYSGGLICGKEITEDSRDKNPGTANAFSVRRILVRMSDFMRVILLEGISAGVSFFPFSAAPAILEHYFPRGAGCAGGAGGRPYISAVFSHFRGGKGNRGNLWLSAGAVSARWYPAAVLAAVFFCFFPWC
jgi:hypothetical protein